MNTTTFYNDHSAQEYHGWAILKSNKGYIIFSEVLEYRTGKVRVNPASMDTYIFDTLGEAMKELRDKVKASKSNNNKSGKTSKKSKKSIDVLGLLGISAIENREQIMKAFRDRVKAMADGKGGYNGDMDLLVQAKERALQSIR
jgi:hypothetical protein